MSNELEAYLKIQGAVLSFSTLPLLIGIWYYRRDRRIDRSGLRAVGEVVRVKSKRRIREITSGPNQRKGRKAQHRYTVAYTCHNGFSRTLSFSESGYQRYHEGDQLEIAFLRENADIARPAAELYVKAYMIFFGVGIVALLPTLVALAIWLVVTLG